MKSLFTFFIIVCLCTASEVVNVVAYDNATVTFYEKQTVLTVANTFEHKYSVITDSSFLKIENAKWRSS